MQNQDTNEIDITYWLGRLDGYLDALSIVNGDFREYRYFADISDIPDEKIINSLDQIYNPECKVTFGETQKISDWVRFLQNEFETSIIKEPFIRSIKDNKDRIFQIAWYIVEMIRIISDDFSAKEIYKCAIKVDCDNDSSDGILYAIPFKDKTLVINFQKVISTN